MQTVDLLDKYFETAFAAPDGIKRLRELILTLAMQGKLVPQNPQDRPASELLKEIEAEKKRLIKEKKIKKSKPLPEITPDEIPYDLPDSWEWVQLGYIALKITDGVHKTPKYLNTGVPFISIKDIDGNTVLFDNCKYISEEEHKQINSRCNPEKGDLLICRIGTLGRATIVDTNKPFSLFVSVGLLKFPQKFLLPEFTHMALHSPLLIQQYDKIKAGGSHTNKLNLKDIPRLLLPLPPLEEQHRIVEKIDRLMEKVDRLEKLQTERDRQQLNIHAAASDRLLNASDKNSFNNAWNFIQNNFNQLYSVTENISELRKLILQLAVMGKLVPQNPHDESASILYSKIRGSIDRLVKQRIEKKISFDLTEKQNHFFPIPDNWLWVKLGSLLKNLKYGTSKKCSYDFDGSAVLRIPNMDVDRGKIILDDLKYTELNESESNELALKPNDLLIIRSNGSKSLVGRPTIVSNKEKNLAYAGYLIRLRSFSEYVYSRYLYFALNTTFVRTQIEKPIRTTSGVKNINSKEIANLLIPLPPLPEQHRIVAKVDRLMALCDELEAQLTNRTAKQTALLNEVMAAI